MEYKTDRINRTMRLRNLAKALDWRLSSSCSVGAHNDGGFMLLNERNEVLYGKSYNLTLSQVETILQDEIEQRLKASIKA